jgi:hypothetical protein
MGKGNRNWALCGARAESVKSKNKRPRRRKPREFSASIGIAGQQDYMIKVLLYSLIFLALVTGCGPQYYLPENRGKPAQIVVSAYTQNGCLEELQEEAKNRALKLN